MEGGGGCERVLKKIHSVSVYIVHSHFMWCSNLWGPAAVHTALLRLRKRTGLSGAVSWREMQGREAGKPTKTVDECVPKSLDSRKKGSASA